jgi:hypothetical protein
MAAQPPNNDDYLQDVPYVRTGAKTPSNPLLVRPVVGRTRVTDSPANPTATYGVKYPAREHGAGAGM